MRSAASVAAVFLLALSATSCDVELPSASFRFVGPPAGELRLASEATPFELEFTPGHVEAGSLRISLDGGPPLPPEQVQSALGAASGDLGVLAPGVHTLTAHALSGAGNPIQANTWFELVAFQNDPDTCEVLNDVECMLPYPSSRFLRPAATVTGWALNFPPAGMPAQVDPDDNFTKKPLSTQPYSSLDGFSPMVQVLMHFPGGVDVEGSGAPRLLEATRSTDLTSLEAGSPTLLIDWETGERILHFIENDGALADAPGADPGRQLTFLRPGRSLEPNHRYIVAVRGLVDGQGAPVRAEPAFAALRDERPTSIAGIQERRASMEALFARLEELGVEREDLILAFDFHTRSDEQLTAEILSMRDQAFQWLDGQMEAGSQTFQVESVSENDCSVPGQALWRVVTGTYQVPLFLDADPEAQTLAPGFLVTDSHGVPAIEGVTNPRFGISIPCSVLQGAEAHPLLWGHGLFGDGSKDVGGIVAGVGQFVVDWELPGDIAYLAGGTRWRGLSDPDIESVGADPSARCPAGGFDSWIVCTVLQRLNNFKALPDRLRQGQVNTLILARMMKRGLFNVDPAFQTPGPEPQGVFPGAEAEMYYFGASLGGIMGLFFSALTPDIVKHNVDVPGVNFSFLLQRATPFLEFELLFGITGLSDPIQIALGIGLLHELWVLGEPAAVVRHIISDPLPGVPPKQILMTMAFLDQQVSNQGTEIAARTMGIPQLEGSLLTNTFLPEIETGAGPLRSAWVTYDTAGLDLDNPLHAPFIPPLTNQQAQRNRCDPHGRRGFIPASVEQLITFLRPDDPGDPSAGRIVNFCEGLCDGDLGAVRPLSDGSDLRLEIPFNDSARCDPLPSP